MHETDRSIQQQLQDIRRSYLAQLQDRIAEIRERWRALLCEPWSPEALTALRAYAHALTDSASSVDLPQISQLAADFAALLGSTGAEGERGLDPATIDQIEQHLARLVDVVQVLPEGLRSAELSFAPVAIPISVRQRAVLLLVTQAQDVGEDLARQINLFGYQTVVLTAPGELLDAIAQHAPAVILLDIPSVDASPTGEAPAPLPSLPQTDLPIVVLSARDDFATRLWAVRAGSRAFLCAPVNMDALVRVLDTLTGTVLPEPFRVVILDDSRVMGALFAAFLREAGMLPLVLADPSTILQALQAFQPDLLVLDMHLPGCHGPELAALIRQHGTFVSLPIVFLSGERDREQQLAALLQGGDEFLVKPITGPQLTAAVTSRIRRARALRRQLSHDVLTGLPTHISITQQALREIARARRYQTPLSVAILDIDHLQDLNGRYGHATGDHALTILARLLQQRLRMSDSIGRYGGDEFLVLLPHNDEASAWRVVDELRTRFADIPQRFGGAPVQVTLSGGVAGLGAEEDDHLLVEAAAAACVAAKHAGRNQIARASRLARRSTP